MPQQERNKEVMYVHSFKQPSRKIFKPTYKCGMSVSNVCRCKCRTTNVMISFGGEFGQILKFCYG